MQKPTIAGCVKSQRPHAHVDIVVDDHLALGVVVTVQPAGILGKRAFPRDRHGKEKGIETGIIEPLAEIAPGRDNDTFLGLGNRGEMRGDVAALLPTYPAPEKTIAS